MILKTEPSSSVCDSSSGLPCDSSIVTNHDTTIEARKLTLTGFENKMNEQQDRNQGRDFGEYSMTATTTRPSAGDQEGCMTPDHSTVRPFSDNLHEHGSHSINDSISNYQAKRQKRASVFSMTTPSMPVGGNDNDNDEGASRMVRRIETPDRGRIMMARFKISKGTFLYRLAAQADVCDTANRTRRCASCLKRVSHGPVEEIEVAKGGASEGRGVGAGSADAGYGCEGCGEIWYCDQSCADRDWEVLHAAECRFLKALYQGVPSTTSDEEDAEEVAWMASVGNPHREAVTRFSQQGFEPYTQDYCRVLIRTLTHRFHEFTDPPLSIQHGASPSDPPYLASADPDQPQGPLPYSNVEDLVMNRASFSRDQVEGEFRNVVRILDAFQSHLETYYLPRQHHRFLRRHRQQQQGAGAGVGAGAGEGNAQKPPRRLLETELMNLIMREECNSFGLYEYPPLTLSPATINAEAGDRGEGGDNSKICYALGLFVRHHLYGFNHSCSPNLFHVAHNNQLLLYAARDILPGEEINITYLEFGPHYRIPPPGAGAGDDKDKEERKRRKEAFEKRKRFLKSHFHFECGCARCTYEAALYSSPSNEHDDNAKMVKGLTKEEDRFLREGLSCEREGCFGFYAPPAVLRSRQDNDGDSDDKGSDNVDEGSEVGGRWGCVACGCLQS
ncbi:hypothetical protein BGZ47_010208 [Haplosporangium gracile]|nr:hypothetical protein BGZ47_010208 [Haplosporangium gracile]